MHKTLGINLWGTIIVCRAAVKYLGRGSSIVDIGSMSSEIHSAGSLAYTATKAGVTGVTGVLAVELGPHSIRVNPINPGAVDTEGARRIGAMTDEARAVHASERATRPGRYTGRYRFGGRLSRSDAARWLTGECLAVSGGHH